MNIAKKKQPKRYSIPIVRQILYLKNIVTYISDSSLTCRKIVHLAVKLSYDHCENGTCGTAY